MMIVLIWHRASGAPVYQFRTQMGFDRSRLLITLAFCEFFVSTGQKIPYVRKLA